MFGSHKPSSGNFLKFKNIDTFERAIILQNRKLKCTYVFKLL